MRANRIHIMDATHPTLQHASQIIGPTTLDVGCVYMELWWLNQPPTTIHVVFHVFHGIDSIFSAPWYKGEVNIKLYVTTMNKYVLYLFKSRPLIWAQTFLIIRSIHMYVTIEIVHMVERLHTWQGHFCHFQLRIIKHWSSSPLYDVLRPGIGLLNNQELILLWCSLKNIEATLFHSYVFYSDIWFNTLSAKVNFHVGLSMILANVNLKRDEV
jgi:hypothetical protein